MISLETSTNMNCSFQGGLQSGWSRNVRMQMFTWDAHNIPIFGESIAEGIELPTPFTFEK